MGSRKRTSQKAAVAVQVGLLQLIVLSIKNTNCRDVRSILNYFLHQEADEELFTSGSAFNFEAPVASPRMTRARRASMSFDAVSFELLDFPGRLDQAVQCIAGWKNAKQEDVSGAKPGKP